MSVLPVPSQSNARTDTSGSIFNSSTAENIAINANNANLESAVETVEETKMNPAEFFISNDGSAILEHTNRVIYLEVI